MKRDDQDKRFTDHLATLLDKEADRLELETLARLKRARYAALEQLEKAPLNWWRSFRLPAAAVAAGVIIAMLTFMDFRSSLTFQDEHALADMEILSSDDQLDLFADLEFYYWYLETEDHAG